MQAEAVPTRLSQEIPAHLNAVAHHVQQHPASGLLTSPEPRPMRTAVLLRGAGQIGSTSRHRGAAPEDLATAADRGGKNLVLQVAVEKTGLRDQTQQLPSLGQTAPEGLLARDPDQVTSA